jgi:transcription antitermination factor NusG
MTTDNKRWYVLYTAPRAEKKAEQRLKQNDLQTFLPLHLSPRRWSDRIKMVEVPFLPSYLFVRTTEHDLRSLVSIQGVSRIVFYNGKPAVIRDKEIKAIELFLEQARTREISYSLEEEVLIACGPLKDISGKIKRVKKKFLVLYLEQLGVTVSVGIDKIIKMKMSGKNEK